MNDEDQVENIGGDQGRFMSVVCCVRATIQSKLM